MELALLLERHMTVCIAMVIVGHLDVNERKTKYNSPKNQSGRFVCEAKIPVEARIAVNVPGVC